MSKFSLSLQNAYENAYALNTKNDYTEPKIYDANGDLSKRWYVYYSFINPDNGLLERQTPIYAKINRFKKLTERREAITVLRKAVSIILKDGYNPYVINEESNEVLSVNNEVSNSIEVVENIKYNISEAVDFALEIRKVTLKDSSYVDFKSRIKIFEKWLNNNGYENKSIDSIPKKAVLAFLNSILISSSASNRNNTRSVLLMFYKTLKDNEIIMDNFVTEINIIKSAPERNKTVWRLAKKRISKH